MENEPVLGEIRKGKDIGKTHGIYYIWFACIECGVPQWVGLRHGKPRNTRCHDCAIRKPWKGEHRRNHEKAIKEMQIQRDLNNQFPNPPVVGEIRLGMYIGHTKGTQAFMKYIWHKCIDCGFERWVVLRKGLVKSVRCKSCSRKLDWNNPKYRDNCTKAMKEAESTPEAREMHRQRANKEFENPEVLAKLSKSLTIAFAKPEYKAKMTKKYDEPEMVAKRSRATAKNWEDEKYRARQLARFERQWADPVWKDKQIGLVADALQMKPNKPEKKIQVILDMVEPNRWMFTGDGKTKIEGKRTVGGKIPDFWNGDHKLIEHFGIRWHNPAVKPGRLTDTQLVEHYAKLGYKCLIIWENEWKEPEGIINKVKEFVKS